MEARSKSSSSPVLPISFVLHRSHSPTRHFNSPSSSSAFNFPVHRTLSPTRASFSGGSSYSSSASTAASSSINLGLGRSTSQVRAARLPISPKGSAAMKSIPCASPRQTSKCEEIRHDEFGGKNRRCGRRMGEKSSHCSHTPIKPPHAKEIVFSATAQQALPYDHGPRCLLKFASGRLSFQLQFWPLSPIVL
eukprot:PITA_26303